ncbi:MAG: aminotransferase class III-fold pyridoxal phosphate-dependent enzyme [Candidatus Levybacteria bacterium]|nr:aminotransferase class III-fold pyridoxal phosphate-dependent enzyme [Candidatus Levybacteria bacterium]
MMIMYEDNPFMLKSKGHSLESSENQVLKQLQLMFRERNDIAAVIIEPVMVNAGGFIFSKRFLKELRNICSKYNVSLIFDEIQTAFGWLGTFFASDFFGVTPDIVTLGKGLSSGFPLAAIIMKEEYDVINYGEDEYTYGGHPISCAVALETIRFLENSNIFSEVMERSNLLKKLLLEMAKTNKEYIKEVRICGLIASLEFYQNKHKDFANYVYKTALYNGLVLRKSSNGFRPSLVLKPPLIVSITETERAMDLLSESIHEAAEALR